MRTATALFLCTSWRASPSINQRLKKTLGLNINLALNRSLNLKSSPLLSQPTGWVWTWERLLQISQHQCTKYSLVSSKDLLSFLLKSSGGIKTFWMSGQSQSLSLSIRICKIISYGRWKMLYGRFRNFCLRSCQIKCFTKWCSGGCQPSSEPAQTPAFLQWFLELNEDWKRCLSSGSFFLLKNKGENLWKTTWELSNNQ